jgi:hypothetical protein
VFRLFLLLLLLSGTGTQGLLHELFVCVKVFLKSLVNCLPGLTSNCDPPDLCLLSS